MIAAIIGIMIAVVVAVVLFPFILEAVKEAKEGLPKDTPEALVAMVDILPIVFVGMVLLGAVGWFWRGREEEVKVEILPDTKEAVYRPRKFRSLKERIEAEEQRRVF